MSSINLLFALDSHTITLHIVTHSPFHVSFFVVMFPSSFISPPAFILFVRFLFFSIRLGNHRYRSDSDVLGREFFEEL